MLNRLCGNPIITVISSYLTCASSRGVSYNSILLSEVTFTVALHKLRRLRRGPGLSAPCETHYKFH